MEDGKAVERVSHFSPGRHGPAHGCADAWTQGRHGGVHHLGYDDGLEALLALLDEGGVQAMRVRVRVAAAPLGLSSLEGEAATPSRQGRRPDDRGAIGHHAPVAGILHPVTGWARKLLREGVQCERTHARDPPPDALGAECRLRRFGVVTDIRKDSPMRTLLLLALLATIAACVANPSPDRAVDSQPLREDVLTAEEQAAMTPYDAIELLREGNQRFVSNDLTLRDHSAMVRRSTDAQYPKAIVLSCVDSRVPVEDVFDRGIGDVFVARVAGNFVNEDILGSMEFACAVSGSKLVLVMGHEHCGAVKAAIDGAELGNITGMLTKIQPAVDAVRSGFSGEGTSSNLEFVHEVCEQNVLDTIATIRRRSPVLADLEAEGEIRIVGAIYDMDTGIVSFLDL